MRTLFVGDVHGCSASLRALVDQVRPDRLILLGDLFAKGPDPAGVWNIIEEYRAESVLGNHDARVLGVIGFSGDSKHHRAARALPEAAHAWLHHLPLFLHGPDWVAVHAGVHPTEGVGGTSRKMALTMRRWPDDENLGNPFWFQLWKGPARVFYGHDAIRGVQVHPHSVGLDSGCVYGNLLSGWILEEERLVQVPGWTEEIGRAHV